MQFDFYLSRVRRDDDGPDILRVDNCTEGKYYDDCCDLESSNDPECVDNQILNWLRYFGISVGVFLILPCLYWIICLFCDGVKTCCKKCYNACCKPQSIVSNENSATRYGTVRSYISTISANFRQPPRPISDRLSLHVHLHYQHLHEPTPTRTPTPQPESLVDRLPRSKASVNQCTGRSKYFF